ncbi:MAG: SURF1 family protein [Alphaproteobacteria bacterium]
MTFRPKLFPTLFTIPALITLIALGTWQLQRLEWKETLIERLHSRAEAPAESLPPGDLDIDEWEFRRIAMTGHFLHEAEMHLLNRSLNGNPGLHVITPFRRTDVPGAPVVLVNRGWVPFQLKDPADREEGLTVGEVTVEGIVRFQRPITGLQRVFLPENEPGNNVWYSIDEAEMQTQAGVELTNYYVVDGNMDVPGTYPLGRQWTLDIRNNHLEYAITWYALAVALLVIYVLYHRGPGATRPTEDA